MAKQGVIFDCDGTLLDSMGMWQAIEADLARRAGAEVTPELVRELTTLTLPEVAELFHGRYGLGRSARAVLDLINELAIEQYRTASVARPGALEVVASLRERGVRCAVASSSSQEMLQAGLANTGFLPYLDAVFSVDDVGASKRQPAVYDAARDAMGTLKELTWGAEDAIYAVKTLNAAGYRSIGIYDCDGSGTWEQLQAEATLPIKSWVGFDVELLL